ncbi:MAG: winged helix-turn-helix transcriptional regulator [Clostridia bacterium]|nr:winged helix-turn-helix transcriptional regulator [Clostridia bacterium]
MQYSDIVSELASLSKNYGEKLKNELERDGLKILYCRLLSALAEEDGGTQLSLVERTGIKAPTVSIMLRQMEKLGLVLRKVDDYDLRKTHVNLTEKGREADKAAKDRIVQMQKNTFGNISEEDLKIFCSVLYTISDNLKS